MKAYIVDKSALENNVRVLMEKAGGTTVWGVVKGDGYGLGCAALARVLASGGVDHFAVTDIREVRALRECFPDAPILMMEAVSDPGETEELLALNAIFTLGTPDDAARLSDAAAQKGTKALAHVKIDTGMGRYGFLPEQAEAVKAVYALPGLEVCGIYTHFNNSSEAAPTKAQYVKFRSLVDQLENPGMVHCCNSAAFWLYPQMRCDAVRIGSAFLGRVTFPGETGLKRIGWCEASIESIRTIPAGHTVGYGAGWTAKRDTEIAVVPVGYFHGFGVDRGFDLWRFKDCLRGVARYVKAFLKKKALYVSVNGRSCRVLGHVGMVNMVIDVTGLACKPGDRAVIDINPLLVKDLEVEYR